MIQLSYKEHKSSDLEEVLLIGQGTYPENNLLPLKIVKSNVFNIENLQVKLYVLAESHAVVVKLSDFTLVQVLACLPPLFDNKFKIISRRQLNIDDLRDLNFKNKITSSIKTTTLNKGVEIYSSFSKDTELTFDFPGIKSAKTSVSIQYNNFNLNIYSFHSYPDENQSVISVLKFKNGFNNITFLQS